MFFVRLVVAVYFCGGSGGNEGKQGSVSSKQIGQIVHVTQKLVGT